MVTMQRRDHIARVMRFLESFVGASDPRGMGGFYMRSVCRRERHG